MVQTVLKKSVCCDLKVHQTINTFLLFQIVKARVINQVLRNFQKVPHPPLTFITAHKPPQNNNSSDDRFVFV